MNAKLNASFNASTVIPARVINIAVDTVYLYSQTSGQYAGAGIYMMDTNGHLEKPLFFWHDNVFSSVTSLS